ncbi:MAG: carboxylesterase family protein [Acidobacteriota bacterium]
MLCPGCAPSGCGPRSDAEANASSLTAFRDEVAWNMQLWAKMTVKRGRKAYVYYFTQDPPVAAGQTSRGATHVAEIAYVFHNGSKLWTDADEKLSQQMSNAWIAFGTKARRGHQKQASRTWFLDRLLRRHRRQMPRSWRFSILFTPRSRVRAESPSVEHPFIAAPSVRAGIQIP